MLTQYSPLLECHDNIGIMLWCHCDNYANARHFSIADTLRKVLHTFEVNLTYGSRVVAIFVPGPLFLIPANTMSTPPGSASGSRIVVQASTNVPLPTYDWNAPEQM